MNSLLIPQRTLNSVIDDRCDMLTAFHRVLSFYDPNKSKNKKSKVLDNTHSNLWRNADYKMFSVKKTNNLSGYVVESKFNVIVYEAPRNKSFFTHTLHNADIYNNLIEKHGIIIVKVNDFKERYNNELRGSFDLKKAFDLNNFFLYDLIVYRYNKVKDFDEYPSNCTRIVHSYFMIFKPISEKILKKA